MPVEQQQQKQHSHHHGKRSGKASVRDVLNTSDLFKLYNMLNVVKVDLLWGRQDADEGVESPMGSTTETAADVRYKQKSASPRSSSRSTVTELEQQQQYSERIRQ
nr:uncharacterized protein LOC115263053 [Aedes albopictus]